MFFNSDVTKDKRNVNLRGGNKTESKKNFLQRVEQERQQRQEQKQRQKSASKNHRLFVD